MLAAGTLIVLTLWMWFVLTVDPDGFRSVAAHKRAVRKRRDPASERR
jgi:hypothetical protein